MDLRATQTLAGAKVCAKKGTTFTLDEKEDKALIDGLIKSGAAEKLPVKKAEKKAE